MLIHHETIDSKEKTSLYQCILFEGQLTTTCDDVQKRKKERKKSFRHHIFNRPCFHLLMFLDQWLIQFSNYLVV